MWSSSEASSTQASAPAQAPGEPPSAAAKALPMGAWRSNQHAIQAVLTVDIMASSSGNAPKTGARGQQMRSLRVAPARGGETKAELDSQQARSL
ncbi:unnamed protein product [Polarella glacialis]|uniref:Uncharacterized protein n=1 Tax=Polarella glacialis TaxID=89957 RepID=A0A813E7I4_POLGL|nr:unnamed protein product [Polarella glacialis]